MALFRDGMRGEELHSLYGAIWALAWPAFFAQGLRSIVMFIIRVIVSQMGEKAYNGVNIGLMVFMLIITLIAAVAVGTTALVAQTWGAGDRARAGRILQQSLLWGFLLSIFIAILGMPISRLLFHLIGADAETIELGSSFMVWLFAAVPFLAPGFFLAAGLRAAGDTRTPMIGAMVMGVVAIILSYGLILGKLGMPRLGTLGAALAIDGSFASFTLFLALLFVFNKNVIKLPLRGWQLNRKTGASIFKIGIPSAMEWILIQLGILLYVFVIYRYGNEAAAGYFTGVAILLFAQAPGHGFLMVIIGIFIYVVANSFVLSRIFGELSPISIGHARTFIILLTIVMPLMGVAFSMGGGFRGAGDTVPPLIASTVGVFGGRIIAAFALYAIFHPPVVVIWCSMFPDLILRILIMSLRLRSGKWKRTKI